MVKWSIVMFGLAALLTVLSAAQSGPQVRVVDLTNTVPNLAEWKVTASGAGGPAGTRPMPPSYVPVAIHLSNCALRNGKFYFSVEIENNRKVEAQIPISMNSKLFDHQGTIRFRQLLLLLGKAANPQDATTFKKDPRFPEFTLLGDQSVPGTLAVVAPGERLVLRLKAEVRWGDQNFDDLRVHVSGFDQTLSPEDDGYREMDTWIPALFAISEANCSESKE
jgi:hypothetical protein